MTVKVSSDSTCDLSPEILQTYDIGILPLHIIKDGQDFRDGVDITPREIFDHVERGGEICSTTAINVAEYLEYFKALRQNYDTVIHICIGSEFSSCYQNACLAAAELDNVYVVDSRNLSTGQGHLVLEAALMAQAGMEAKEIFNRLIELAEQVEASFLIDKLDYLRKGGRCSSLAALGANLLNIKPCIEVINGKMQVGKKYRGSFEKCILQYVKDKLEGRKDLNLKRIFITHPAVPSHIVDKVREAVKQYADFEEIIETRAGCTISCHCGPVTLGILFIRENR